MRAAETYEELSYRLGQVVGVPFGQLARLAGHQWKGNPGQNRGFAGRLIDELAGSDESNRAVPDIKGLGIEIKTIPINLNADVLQATKIGSLNYSDVLNHEWWESTTFHKLRSICFVPVVKHDTSAPDAWFIRRPFLWLPSAEILAQFKADYESVRRLILAGTPESISSAEPPDGQGKYLHPKPSAPKGTTRRVYELGDKRVSLQPKAWMLRPTFTQPIVSANLKLNVELFGQIELGPKKSASSKRD